MLPTNNLDAHEGDGVCPSLHQFNLFRDRSYYQWLKTLNLDVPHLFDIHNFLDFIRQIPPFKLIAITRPAFPLVDFELEWETSIHPDCDQPLKRTRHHLDLAVTEPVIYRKPESPISNCQQFQIRITLAWAFILSSQWVEILRAAGYSAALQYTNAERAIDFWDTVDSTDWQAIVIHRGKVFYAPWSLRKTNSAESHYFDVKPETLPAFERLKQFCISRNAQEEFVLGLAATIMIPQLSTRTLDFSYVQTSKTCQRSHKDTDCYDSIFKLAKSCITLSCTPSGIDSILCAVFFDASVPCNLVGAHLRGIQDACEPLNNDQANLVQALSKQRKDLAFFWLAAAQIGHLQRVLRSSFGGLPPISLPTAAWTRTQETFVQSKYQSSAAENDRIERAYEFSMTFMTEQPLSVPLTPSPPFGDTLVQNIRLDVREHLAHEHQLLKHNTYWMTADGRPELAQEEVRKVQGPVIHIETLDKSSLYEKRSLSRPNSADRVSADATFNLFNWHRNNEGGLWLAEDKDDEKTRNLLSHPWIADMSDDEQSDSESKSDLGASESREWGSRSVLNWVDSIDDQLSKDFSCLSSSEETARVL